MTPPRPGASASRLFTPAFIGLGLVELAYFTAQGITIPLTPLFAAGPLGADEVGVGITGRFSLPLATFALERSPRRSPARVAWRLALGCSPARVRAGCLERSPAPPADILRRRLPIYRVLLHTEGPS